MSSGPTAQFINEWVDKQEATLNDILQTCCTMRCTIKYKFTNDSIAYND